MTTDRRATGSHDPGPNAEPAPTTRHIAREATPSMTFQSLAWSQEDDSPDIEPFRGPEPTDDPRRAHPRPVPWFRRPQLVLGAAAVLAVCGIGGLAYTGVVHTDGPGTQPSVLDTDAAPLVEPAAPPPTAPPGNVQPGWVQQPAGQQPGPAPAQQPPAQQPPASVRQQPPAAPPVADPPAQQPPKEAPPADDPPKDVPPKDEPPKETKTCADGTVIGADQPCLQLKDVDPIQPENPMHELQIVCWDGSVKPVGGDCPINPQIIKINPPEE